MRNKLLFSITFLSLILLVGSCNKDEMVNSIEPIDEFVKKEIDATIGGSLQTSENIKLTIPPGSLSESGTVSLGRTFEEPQEMPNNNFSLIVDPITLKLPTSSLNNPIQLSFPITGTLNEGTANAVLFNGTDYIPMDFIVSDGEVQMSIDILKWDELINSGRIKKTEFILSYTIYFVFEELQTPDADKIGLKKVIVNGDDIVFTDPESATYGDVLVLIHGWIGDQTTWTYMIKELKKNAEFSCKTVFTFVYDSGLPIATNAKKLYDHLDALNSTGSIEIVAHSMGGLVSRCMIENSSYSDVADRVSKLITLGTPHRGSPLAIIRYVIGAVIAADSKTYSPTSMAYSLNSRGLRDMLPTSEFISDLNDNLVSKDYYLIAGRMDSLDLRSWWLVGPDDGVVEESSAFGVSSKERKYFNTPVTDKYWILQCHTVLPNDAEIYEQVMNYLTACSPPESTVLDSDGNSYNSVVIGTQTWMKENLRTTKFNDNTPIPTETNDASWIALTTPAYCWYENDEITYKSVSGALYNFYAVNTNKLCPIGWHVPSDDEWKVLEMFLGMTQTEVDQLYVWRGTDQGAQLKSETGWHLDGNGTNTSGFSGLPVGMRNIDGSFDDIGVNTIWWSSTDYICRNLNYNTSQVLRYNPDKFYGNSVRCLKD